eukprot:15432830-Alexandrium_andersonii.AAC.1
MSRRFVGVQCEQLKVTRCARWDLPQQEQKVWKVPLLAAVIALTVAASGKSGGVAATWCCHFCRCSRLSATRGRSHEA